MIVLQPQTCYKLYYKFLCFFKFLDYKSFGTFDLCVRGLKIKPFLRFKKYLHIIQNIKSESITGNFSDLSQPDTTPTEIYPRTIQISYLVW